MAATNGAACAFEGCSNPRYGLKRVCSTHYTAIWRGTAQLPEPTRPLPTGWMAAAACRGEDPEVWFPVSESFLHPVAEQVCGGCPVRSECLEWALDSQPLGIAGGLTSEERRQIRKDRKADAGQLVTAGGAR